MAKQVPIKAPSPINIVYSSINNYSSSIHFWPDFVLSQMAKLLLIISPSEKIKINPSIITIVLDYKLSIHFLPDLV